MEKELKILIEMCLQGKDAYSPSSLASFLHLKYTEGVYPYLKRLENKNFIVSLHRGEYSLNKQNEKVEDIIFITNMAGKRAEILFTKHAKKVLEKFSNEPLLKRSKLPKKSLELIKDIANHTRIIHPINGSYFISSWEEPTKRLLNFFDITIKFDEEEFKHNITKYYSQLPNTSSPADDAQQKELKSLNMEGYLSNKDYILDKLKELDFNFLAFARTLTDSKKREFSDNPFSITSKITDWKANYIYNTDRIEGNALTMEQVKTILTTGGLKVEQDKKFVLETINSRTALDNIFDTTNELTIEFIKKLHIATQWGIDPDVGKYKMKENCITDSWNKLIDTTTPAEFVGIRLESLMRWYNDNKDKLHPFVLAAVFHNQFVYIHPFNDGNGRVSRLIFNFILIKHGYFPIIFYNDEKEKYYSYIRGSKTGDMRYFVSYCFELYRTQLGEF